MIHAQPARLLCVAAGVAALLTGCATHDNTSADGPATSTAPTPVPPPTPTGVALPPSYGDQRVPIPPGTSTTVIESTAQAWRLLLTGAAPETVLAFYDQALPVAGFDVDASDDRPVGLSAENADGLTIIIVASVDATLVTVRP